MSDYSEINEACDVVWFEADEVKNVVERLRHAKSKSNMDDILISLENRIDQVVVAFDELYELVNQINTTTK